jgi:hypothetical protein
MKMTDDLDPKLRELEANLRRLKPFRGDGRRQTADRSNFSRYTGVVRRYVLATSAIVLFVVCLIPQREPQLPEPTVVAIPDSLLPSAVCPLPSDTMPSPTMRQQLTELLAEMNVAELSTVAKVEYPVVEIVVQAESVSRYSGTENGRPQKFSFRRTLYDEEMLMMF